MKILLLWLGLVLLILPLWLMLFRTAAAADRQAEMAFQRWKENREREGA